MLFNRIMGTILAAIAKAVAKTTANAVEAGVAKGIQTGLTNSFGDFKLPDDVQSEIDRRVAVVPDLLTDEARDNLALTAMAEDEKKAPKVAPKRRKK